jgi:hypothetical protein
MVTMTVRRSVRLLTRLRAERRAGVAINPEISALAHAIVAALASFIVSGTFLTQAFTWPIYILISLALAMTRFGELNMLGPSPSPGPDGNP